MIANNQQLETTLEGIAWFEMQVAHLCKTETNPVNDQAALFGYLAEIDRMHLAVREYSVSFRRKTRGRPVDMGAKQCCNGNEEEINREAKKAGVSGNQGIRSQMRSRQ